MERRLASARLAVLEEVGFVFGFLKGPRSRGRRPRPGADVYPELQSVLLRKLQHAKTKRL